MDIFSAIVLGVVQGLTEFLPISSSGHLILAREILGLQTEYGLAVDAVLQLATAFAVLVYFRKDLIRLVCALYAMLRRQVVQQSDRTLILALVIATIPAAAVGYFLEDIMETTFRSAELVAWTLLLGALLFAVAEWVGKKYQEKKSLSITSGLWIGLFQVLALIPGMSRSGVTISGGLFFGLSREQAARFSFLLALPIIGGSGFKKLLELGGNGFLSHSGVALFFGALSAFVVGVLAIHYLLKYLRNHTLGVFIVYRIILALIVFSIAYYV